MVLCYHPSSHSDGLRDVPDFLSVTSCSQWQLARPSWRLPLGGARTVERQDELRGVWLGVRALGAEAAHGVGEGELPDRRAGDHVVGAASCSEVSCNSSVRYATELMSRRPLAHQTREFCCMQMKQGCSLSNCMGEAQIDAVGLRRRIRLRGLWCASCDLRELRRIQVAGAMPADVVGTMLRSAARHLCFDGLIRTYHIMGSNAASDGISKC